ncbi:MAG: transcription antitermination factor NusB [Prevotellaceae bacterium]|nr:transcription antitermination factor NusB [Prevotellaceae bacterium]
MINRELIRLKTVQIVYAYYLNDGKSIDTTEKELFHSLAQAYSLYMQLLSLLLSLDSIARRVIESQVARSVRLCEPTPPAVKLMKNRFIAQLRDNEQLEKWRSHQHFSWLEEEEDFLRRLFSNISTRDFFLDYTASPESSYEEDRELWRKIYRNVLCENEELDEILEGANLYWNDDKFIVDTFVLKTIRRFDEQKGKEQELLPDFSNDEDKEFASQILRNALTNQEFYRNLISEQTKNWELDRIARMDLYIIQVALAEILSFPGIPVSVSINEYVEIAKDYSTPRSGSYVNGMLDSLCRRLVKEGLLVKDMDN